jgi:hypothetical protein
MIKLRFPPMVAVLIPALVATARPLLPQRRGLLGVALAGTLWNAGGLTLGADRVSAFVTGADAGNVRGEIVAAYWLSPEEHADSSLLHAASYYCLLHGCVDIGNYQAHSHQFFVRFKETPELQPIHLLAHEPRAVDWGRYLSVSVLLGWQLDEPERRRVSRWFDLDHDTGDVSVWRRRVGSGPDGAPGVVDSP